MAEPVRAVCFDAYGTLVGLDDPVGRLARNLSSAIGQTVPAEAASDAFAGEVAVYRANSLRGGDEAGRRALVADCAAALGAQLARHVPHGLPTERLADILLDSLHWRLLPGVSECLRSLATRGVKMAVVSNWDCSLARVLAERGLADRFAVVVSSAEQGCEKPSPRIWAPALAALGLPAEAVAHVGDEPEADIAGAAAAGLRPILLGPADPPDGLSATRIASLAELPAVLGYA